MQPTHLIDGRIGQTKGQLMRDFPLPFGALGRLNISLKMGTVGSPTIFWGSDLTSRVLPESLCPTYFPHTYHDLRR